MVSSGMQGKIPHRSPSRVEEKVVQLGQRVQGGPGAGAEPEAGAEAEADPEAGAGTGTSSASRFGAGPKCQVRTGSVKDMELRWSEFGVARHEGVH